MDTECIQLLLKSKIKYIEKSDSEEPNKIQPKTYWKDMSL